MAIDFKDVVVAGIDPSLSCTAVAVWTPGGIEVETISTKPYGSSVKRRMDRLAYIAAKMMAVLRRHGANSIWIEGYAMSMGKGQAQHSAIVELGGLLRWHLVDVADGPVVEVSPTSLKKFAVGKGNAPKDMVAANLTKRYGVLFDENNSYDAYGLCRLGMVAEGIEPAANAAQREAVDVVLQSRAKE